MTSPAHETSFKKRGSSRTCSGSLMIRWGAAAAASAAALYSAWGLNAHLLPFPFDGSWSYLGNVLLLIGPIGILSVFRGVIGIFFLRMRTRSRARAAGHIVGPRKWLRHSLATVLGFMAGTFVTGGIWHVVGTS